MSLYQDTPLIVGPFQLDFSASSGGDSISYSKVFERVTMAQMQHVRRACVVDNSSLEPTNYAALRRNCETAGVFAYFGASQPLSDLEEGQSPATLTGWTAGGTTSDGDTIYLRADVTLTTGFSCLGVNGTPTYPDLDDPMTPPYDAATLIARNAIPFDHPEFTDEVPRNCEQQVICEGNASLAVGFFGSATLRWTRGSRYYPISFSANGTTFAASIGTPVPDWPEWIGTIPHAANAVVKYNTTNYRALVAIPAQENGETNDPPPSDSRWEAFNITEHIQITKYPNGVRVAFIGMFLNDGGFNLIQIISQSLTQAPASSSVNAVSIEIEAIAFGTAGGLFDPATTYPTDALAVATTFTDTSGSYTDPTDFSLAYSNSGTTVTFGVPPP